MHDLDDQIREYVDATSKPLTVDDVLSVPVGEARFGQSPIETFMRIGHAGG
jgi:hypothetical protein